MENEASAKIVQEFIKKWSNYAFGEENFEEGYSHLSKGEIDKAEFKFGQACKNEYSQGCLNLAVVQVQLNKIDEALKTSYKLCNQGIKEGCNLQKIAQEKKEKENQRKREEFQTKLTALSLVIATLDAVYDKGATLPQMSEVKDDFQKQGKIAFDDKDYKKAFKIYKEGCEKGSPDNCSSLGRMYYEGLSVKENRKEARILWEQSCQKSSVRGCFNLGVYHQNADNTAQAIENYQKSCEAGFALGCNNLAWLLNKKSEREAQRYFEMACDGDIAESCHQVGIFRYNEGQKFGTSGLYGAGKESTGIDFLNKACRLGDELACVNATNAQNAKNLRKAIKSYGFYW